MIIRKTTLDAIHHALTATGLDADIRHISASQGGGETFNVKVNLPDGENRETYRRISPRGHRVSAVCWHGFRDFFRALYEITPDAVVKTPLATYNGTEGFEATFPATGNRNIGSQAFPFDYADACICADTGDRF